MPGTFALSLQGALLYEKNYVMLGVIIAASLILLFLSYSYREKIYLLVERLENK
jgi:NO-binding membrane sensor protein with MHYT domain